MLRHVPHVSCRLPRFFAKAAVLLDEEGNPIASENNDLDAVSIGDDELKRLSAFADFIEELNMDETGEDKRSV